jgi:23S rRNA (adenine2503-C2)-methyltransferase
MSLFVYDLGLPEWESLFEHWGEPSYRGQQMWTGLYQHFWHEPAQFTTFPKDLRERIAREGTLAFSHLTPLETRTSEDHLTQKALFELPDGQAIETVLMDYPRSGKQDRHTLCISSQAGCAMGCVFCATGQMGFRRNLSSGEIVEQVVYFARHLAKKGDPLTNIVFMGMGEPFHNYEHVMEAIRRLNHPEGMNLGARRFTISTVGIVPKILKLAEEDLQVNLAVSLHEVHDQKRSSMMPVNQRYPISELFTACRAYVQKTNRRITFEWALIQDQNDSAYHALKLADLIGDMLAHVNIIPLNPTQGYAGEATTAERAQAFQAILEERGIPCTIRQRKGIEIQAGCGQLASRHQQDQGTQ